MLRKVRIIRPDIPPGRRIIVISDIHGNPPFLQGLLEKVGLDRDDILILLGDLVEKGPGSLELLHFAMGLTRQYRVYPLCGNCDDLVREFVDQDGYLPDEFYLSYLPRHPESLIWQMADPAGAPRASLQPRDLVPLRRAIQDGWTQELDFLRAMPHILETEHLLFVHGGVPSMEHMERLDAWRVMKNDDFMGQNRSFEKYCIVGHWPVTLYDDRIPVARPILDRARRILSIDGGCSLKADGQLNALILPSEESEDFLWTAYDGLGTVTALDPQQASKDSVNIRWGHSALEVLRRGEETTLCRHLESGRTLEILNQYLFETPGKAWCEDSTDYELGVSPGDTLALVARTRQGILAKKDGVTGWYRGRYTTHRKERDDVKFSPLDGTGPA